MKKSKDSSKSNKIETSSTSKPAIIPSAAQPLENFNTLIENKNYKNALKLFNSCTIDEKKILVTSKHINELKELIDNTLTQTYKDSSNYCKKDKVTNKKVVFHSTDNFSFPHNLPNKYVIAIYKNTEKESLLNLYEKNLDPALLELYITITSYKPLETISTYITNNQYLEAFNYFDRDCNVVVKKFIATTNNIHNKLNEVINNTLKEIYKTSYTYINKDGQAFYSTSSLQFPQSMRNENIIREYKNEITNETLLDYYQRTLPANFLSFYSEITAHRIFVLIPDRPIEAMNFFNQAMHYQNYKILHIVKNLLDFLTKEEIESLPLGSNEIYLSIKQGLHKQALVLNSKDVDTISTSNDSIKHLNPIDQLFNKEEKDNIINSLKTVIQFFTEQVQKKNEFNFPTVKEIEAIFEKKEKDSDINLLRKAIEYIADEMQKNHDHFLTFYSNERIASYFENHINTHPDTLSHILVIMLLGHLQKTKECIKDINALIFKDRIFIKPIDTAAVEQKIKNFAELSSQLAIDLLSKNFKLQYRVRNIVFSIPQLSELFFSAERLRPLLYTFDQKLPPLSLDLAPLQRTYKYLLASLIHIDEDFKKNIFKRIYDYDADAPKDLDLLTESMLLCIDSISSFLSIPKKQFLSDFVEKIKTTSLQVQVETMGKQAFTHHSVTAAELGFWISTLQDSQKKTVLHYLAEYHDQLENMSKIEEILKTVDYHGNLSLTPFSIAIANQNIEFLYFACSTGSQAAKNLKLLKDHILTHTQAFQLKSLVAVLEENINSIKDVLAEKPKPYLSSTILSLLLLTTIKSSNQLSLCKDLVDRGADVFFTFRGSIILKALELNNSDLFDTLKTCKNTFSDPDYTILKSVLKFILEMKKQDFNKTIKNFFKFIVKRESSLYKNIELKKLVDDNQMNSSKLADLQSLMPKVSKMKFGLEKSNSPKLSKSTDNFEVLPSLDNSNSNSL